MPPHSPRIAVLVAFVSAIGCHENEPTPDAKLVVDGLLTVAVQVGGDPLVTGRATNCPGAPPAVAYADGIEVSRLDAVTFFATTTAEGETVPEDLRFQMSIPSAALSPAVYGLPLTFDLELEVECNGVWVRSEPYPMTYLPTLASLVPPFRPMRFWPASSQAGDLLVCDDTLLVLYEGGATPIRSMDVGFPCSATDMSEGFGMRRYLRGDLLGIAAVDGDDTVAWSRPCLLVESKVDATRDPVVLRKENNLPVLVVLDRATGADKAGPLTLPRTPLGPLARAGNDDILVLESERGDIPETLTYTVQRLSPDLTDLGSIVVATYRWRAPTYVAVFADTGDAVYVAAAPDGDTSRWIEKIDTSTGSLLWATSPTDGWLYPLGDAYGRTIVASDAAFTWLNLVTGAPESGTFAPDSGNNFLRAYVEPDGSLVMLADDTSGVAQGLYLFAPDGRSTLRFHPGAALFRWLSPGWGTGSLVSFFNEVHWLYARQGYDDLLVP